MLKNYKIKVNNEAESKEAQELFEQLGYKLVECHRVGMVAVNDGEIYPDVIGNWDEYNGKELTLPQLRDLVVLHRNDVKDANYSLFISISQPTLELYKKFYAYAYGHHAWTESFSVGINTPNLKPVQKLSEEQGLISGADALRSLADGKEVEFKTRMTNWNLINKNDAYAFSLFLDDDSSFSFRLKPRTITLNIEIPAPFEPKDGEKFYTLETDRVNGYNSYNYVENNFCKILISNSGAWRTEEEIKQVVAVFRGAICTK